MSQTKNSGELTPEQAHSLKNFFSGILMQHTLALGKLEAEHPAYRHLDKASDAAKKAADLIREPLEQSGGETQQTEMAPLEGDENNSVVAPSSKAFILVVEDDRVQNEGICELLHSYGYQVRSAFNGLEALKILDQSLPDIVICDISMPDMDGYTLLKQARTESHLRTLPFIFLTGYSSSDDQIRAKEIGIDDYLVKPPEPQALIASINNVMRRVQNMEAQTTLQLDALRSQIVEIIQHEFRTPLSFILLSADYLQGIIADKLEFEELSTSIEAILEGGTRLEKLIQTFLLMAEIQQRKLLTGETASLRAADVLNQMCREMSTKFEEAELTPIVSENNHDLYLFGEPRLLQESLKRLMDNAIQYRRPSESKTVWLSVERLSDAYLGLRIKDEGRGIPAEEVERLAHSFELANRRNRTQSGAGLSLALVRQIAILHGGRLEIESEEGVGSTFTIWLPMIDTLPPQ